MNNRVGLGHDRFVEQVLCYANLFLVSWEYDYNMLTVRDDIYELQPYQNFCLYTKIGT